MSRGPRARARTAAVTVGMCLALLAMAGCGQNRPAVSAADPRLGACHDLIFEPEVTATTDANPSVSCNSSHTMETFAVGQVGGSYATWKRRPDRQVLQSLTTSICPVDALRAFLGAGARDAVTGVAIHAYFPSEAAWAAGARSASCDVSVEAGGGGPVRVSVSLRQVMAKPVSAVIRRCYRQKPLAGGGWALAGKTTTCNRPHSSQDISAWLQLDTSTVPLATVTSFCAPYVLQVVTAETLLAERLQVTGVVVPENNGTYSLHCAIGGVSTHGDTTSVFLTGTHL